MNMEERLYDLRKRANYSQEQLSDMLGISRQAVSKWESGQGKPEIENVIKLMEIYKVSADYILIGQENYTQVVPKQKKELSHTTQKTIGIIAIIASTAMITVLFILALGTLSKLGI